MQTNSTAKRIPGSLHPAGSAIPMKQWRAEEAARLGITEMCVAMRLSRGKYPNLNIKRINKRVVLVLPNK